MMRIGLVGTESTHVDHMIRYCNAERRGGDARIVAVASEPGASGSTGERDVGLPVVPAAEDLIGLVDAVIVTDRNGGQHAAHALPLLAAGLPVLVDKPLAVSVADAEAMIRAAERYDAPLTSYSALRWLPEVRALIADAPPSAVAATGPVDPDSPHGGVHFYGVHPVEMALTLCRGDVGAVQVTRTRDAIVACAAVGGTAVTVTMVRPDPKPVPFHLSVVAEDCSLTTAEPVLDDHYLYPGLDAFFAMVRSGVPPVPYDELLRSVRFLAAVSDALDLAAVSEPGAHLS
ncbi:Gfo/Idh/MocA family oxidoreductase [Catenulispora pinisilvae]|uniref:Gfo/Idh/MocA family oxidoreductase n=1 Tax=Catenulispora pinisilvae TaxID=2705253 RepID=UPI0018917440|nr:Gfo/Idh/MocA family oxidoreductase [Catenulispora pinisilvae]